MDKDHIRQIVRLQLAILTARMAKRNLQISFADALVDHLAEAGFDPAFGARPLKRLIQKELEDALAKRILAGKFSSGQTIRLDYNDAQGLLIQ